MKPGEGGGIGAWDIRAARHALAAVMRRRPEAYHETLRAHEAAGRPARVGRRRRRASGDDGDGGGAPASIHDIVMVKEPGLAALLFYDDHERRSGLVRFLAPGHDARGVRDRPRRPSSATCGDGTFAVDHSRPDRSSLSRDGRVAGRAASR